VGTSAGLLVIAARPGVGHKELLHSLTGHLARVIVDEGVQRVAGEVSTTAAVMPPAAASTARLIPAIMVFGALHDYLRGTICTVY
jgi:hypothetical protein